MNNLLDMPFTGLYKVISGGQTGADQAGLYCALYAGLDTGGHISRGYRTVLGNEPVLKEIFGLVETTSRDYPPRTKQNATNSDGTIRLASNFNTPGEVLTLRYVKAAGKPCLSMLLDGKDYDRKAEELVEFVINHSIGCLNVAGNADRDKQFGYHFSNAGMILTSAFELLRQQNLLIQA